MQDVMDEGLRFGVRVRPGASRTAVGGRYGEDALVVAVGERAVDGAANRAVRAALASALGVRPAAVEIVSGATGRSKIVAVDGDRAALSARLAELLGPPDRRGE
ncbi:MAG TPA: DUF167 domain-containing protein [Jatrophihabitans sp.]|nr:DUF167 domain-containing protein [Jatrophihabitans sp.]